MLMSKPASCCALAGSPNLGDGVPAGCGVAHAASAAAANSRRRLGVDIFYAAAGADRPAHDGVVVKADIGREARLPFAPRRLHVAFLVRGAALQDRGSALPLPRMAEAHQRLGALGAGQCRLGPGLAAVGRDFAAPAPAGAAPADAGVPGEPVSAR